MKLTSIEKLYTLLKSFSETPMPIHLAYKITKLLPSVETDYSFYLEKTREIIIKYAKKDDQGNPIPDENGNVSLETENISLAEKELLELSDIEIDLPNITFSLDELESLTMTPSDLQVLLHFIEDQE